MNFPKSFLWGAATASYQIEGGVCLDGKGASIWDIFSHTNGKVANMENGDIACDHYHRFKEDIAIMKELGLQAYRFSFSWPRLFPNGDNVANDAGFKFYDELVDTLLANGIMPYATLFHWDLPQALEDKGGFWNEEISDIFAEYAYAVTKHFAGRIEHIATINEPQIFTMMGHQTGEHAPGSKFSQEELAPLVRNVLLAHGKAVRAIRQANPSVKISLASTGELCYPSRDLDSQIAIARKASFPTCGDRLLFTHNAFLDPIILKENHLDFLKLSREDLEIIGEPIDCLGVNIYNGHEYDENGIVPRYQGYPLTALNWPVTEKVMEYGIFFLYERYHLPIYITENGLACHDKIYLDGKVHDLERIDFMERYLNCLNNAITHGADVRGYFHWSLLDNFEWHTGYAPRFGLVYVDFKDNNLTRIIKDSGYYYRDLIKKHTTTE